MPNSPSQDSVPGGLRRNALDSSRGSQSPTTMIDLLVEHGGEAARDVELIRALAAYDDIVKLSARRADPSIVRAAESIVREGASKAFAFDSSGSATLKVGGEAWAA